MSVIYFDCEWDKNGKLITFQWYDLESQKFGFYLNDTPSFYSQVKEFIAGKTLIGYNITSDFTIMLKNGIEVFDLIQDYEDLYLMTLLVFYKHFSEQSKLPLDEALRLINVKFHSDKSKMQKFFIDFKPQLFSLPPEAVEYIKQDVIHLPQLHNVLLSKLDKKRKFLYEKVEKPMVKITSLMNAKGFKVDVGKLFERINTLQQVLQDKENEIRGFDEKLQDINLNSPIQLQRYFNVDSVSKQALVELAQTNELAKKILEYRQLEKELQYCEQLLKLQKNGLIYGTFFPTSAPSGRMSCKSPNIQQIPRSLRDLFVSRYENGYLVVVDFPQIEIRLTALFYSGVMRDLLKRGLDLHTETAKMLFTTKKEITKEDRQIAKSANFGLLYGMGWKKFKDYVFTNTGIKLQDVVAQKLVENWFRSYVDIRVWHDRVSTILNRDKFYEDQTILFRKYYTTELNKALNYKIQGSGADLLKAVVVKFFKNYNAIPIALIHDEFVYDAQSYEEAQDLLNELVKTIDEVWKLFFDIARDYHNIKTDYFPLPIEVDRAIIKTWAEK